MNPEERARQQIDLLFQQSGWIFQDRSQTNLAAGPGVAIRDHRCIAYGSTLEVAEDLTL